MDFLSELFRDAGLVRRLLDVRAIPPSRALRFPCERSFGFHVVLEGTVFVHVAGRAKPLELRAGDVALMARGTDHVLAARPALAGVRTDTIALDGAPHPARSGAPLVASGAWQLWHAPVHPLFTELPAWHVRRASGAPGLDPVALTVAMLADEARHDAPGRDTVVHGLLDSLFVRLVRDALAATGTGAAGFGRAVHDRPVREAVALLHADPARAWTVASLARAVSLSRSALAERFRAAMGDPPLAYLRTVRLQRAMRLLVEGDATLERIAAAVGYGDAFGFAKAFKRAVGMTPGEFRRADAASRGVAWRFGRADAVGG